MSPLISVVIPVFNRSAELRRALESLERQTLRDFEVVICDDGSTEDIQAVLAFFDRKLSMSYLRIENSGGPARPRNVATGVARGKWIAFLDSDDWWDDDRFEIVSVQLGDHIDILYHPLRIVRGKNVGATPERRAVIGEPFFGDALRHFALVGNPIANSAAVVRRDCLMKVGGICEDPLLVSVEDFDTWLRLLAIGARLHYLDRVLGSYWIGSDGISKFSRKQIDRLVFLFDRNLPLLNPDLRRVAAACHNYRIGSLLIQIGGNNLLAREYLIRADGLPQMAMRVKRMLKLLLTFVTR